MKETIKRIELENDVKVIYVTLSGSKLYGTDNKNSDTDYKFIYIPSKDSILLKQDKSAIKVGKNTKEKNTSEDIDFDGTNIYNFFSQLSKSETGAIDIIFSAFSEHNIIYKTPEMDVIKENYKMFLNSDMKSFIGYALGQTKKFGIKGARYDELDSFVKELFDTIPTEVVNKSDKIGDLLFDDMKKFINAKEYKYIKFIMAPGPRGSGTYDDVEYVSILGKMFEGNVSVQYFIERVMKLYNQFGNRTKSTAQTESKTDFKSLSHSLRISSEVKELLETEFIKFPLKNADYIREIKEGKHDVQTVIDEISEVLDEVDVLLLKSSLPEKPDEDKVNKFLLSILNKEWDSQND